MSHTTAPDWFHNAVVDGVQLLHSLALQGSPAAEVITITTTGWIEVLWRGRAWAGDQQEPLQAVDAQRVRLAFFSLANSADRWPPPRQLLDHLPDRPESIAIVDERPPMSPERRAQMAALKRRLADYLVSTPQGRAVRVDTSVGGACGSGGDQGLFDPAPQATADAAGRETET